MKILSSDTSSVMKQVLADPDRYRLQIIYTQIDRDRNNKPSFRNLYLNCDPALYFNPASMVKLPLALLSLEKLHALKTKGIDKHTTVLFDSIHPWQRPLYRDSSSLDGLPSIAHFIKRAFLISENDPYNRMYQFVGQASINRLLNNKGYKDVRITRQFLGLTERQNRHTPSVRFVDNSGKLLHYQPPAINQDSFDFSTVIKLGKGYYNSQDSLIPEPFDFTRHNNLPLESLQEMLQAVMFPGDILPERRFLLDDTDYTFLRQYLSQYPSETPDPKYDSTLFFDSYVKFFFRDSTGRMPRHIRVFNKVGWAYGFLTDVSYVADFANRIEFMLSATIYVNSDNILNDDKYDYDSVGYPFLFRLGQAVLQYELHRKRTHPPDLSSFMISYEKRSADDKRPSLRQVDN